MSGNQSGAAIASGGSGGTAGGANRMQVLNHRLKNRGGKFQFSERILFFFIFSCARWFAPKPHCLHRFITLGFPVIKLLKEI